MKRVLSKKSLAIVLTALPLLTAHSDLSAGELDAELKSEIARHAAPDEISVILSFVGKANPTRIMGADADKPTRHHQLVKALKEMSEREQQPTRLRLAAKGWGKIKQLWLRNEIAVTVRADEVEQLAQLPGVSMVRLDSVLQVPTATQAAASVPEWNLSMIHASEIWALGYAGNGIVVGNLDTGVDVNHPDLASTWRGGSNSWYDPYAQHATPYDANGHGTQTMGIMVGGSTGGTAIGVAPSARWIAAKVYNDAGQALLSDIHLGFQWMLDPDGNPATADAPDVINASWGLGVGGQCVTEFENDIQTLKAVGIAVVFAAGNAGPNASTSESPANNPSGFSAGAVDSIMNIGSFSSRGPSACDGSIFPKLTAPGVNINTSDLSFGGLPLYVTVTGTSFASPHVAGAMALLLNAYPQTSVAALEAALTQSALDLGTVGADNDYGYGLVDVVAAYNLLAASQPPATAPTITSAPVVSATEGTAYSYLVTATDSNPNTLIFALDAAPSGMTINSTSGLISWTPTTSQAGSSYSVSVRVTDGINLSATQSFSIAVARINHPPVAANDSYSVAQGATLSVAARGVLSNDTDVDGNVLSAVRVSNPLNGLVTLNSDGSFTYKPNTGFAGTDSFTYLASDGALSSNISTVTITVTPNKAPVALDDVASTKKNLSVVINVLANDSDADGTLNPASVVVVAAPQKGGRAVVNSNGTVTFTPKVNFVGTDVFTYRVADNLGAYSKVATVQVRVR